MMETDLNETLQRIGQGFCGSVWAAPIGSENAFAFKREDGGPNRSVHDDFIMHQKVLEGLSAGQARILVPGCHQYVRGGDQTWWDKKVSKVPKDFQIPCNVLVTDRIAPLPEAVRDTLINTYCPKTLKPSTRLSEPDKDCLIRPYLGRRRRLLSKSMFQAFSLRNFPLHLDQIEELGLDGRLYAEIMAETLAELYWRAHVDANDVEFVLAPPKDDRKIQSEGHLVDHITITSHALGEHAVWILDFDCCKHMPMDEAGVEQAVAAFYRNDPYYPRPGRDDIKEQTLWREFKLRFLTSSAAIIDQESSQARLPVLWIDLVERKGQP